MKPSEVSGTRASIQSVLNICRWKWSKFTSKQMDTTTGQDQTCFFKCCIKLPDLFWVTPWGPPKFIQWYEFPCNTTPELLYHLYLVGGFEHEVYDFPYNYREFNHPIWLIYIFFSRRGWNHQVDRITFHTCCIPLTELVYSREVYFRTVVILTLLALLKLLGGWSKFVCK